MAGRGFGHLKLSSKLILLFFVIIIMHAAVSLLSLTYIISQTTMNSQEMEQEKTTAGISRYLTKIVNDLQIKAKLFSGQNKIINYTEFGLYHLLQKQLTAYQQTLGIDSISIYNDKLEPIANSGEQYIMDKRFESTLEQSRDGIAQRFLTMGVTDPILTVTLPVKRDYHPLAVMAVGIKIDKKFIREMEAIFNTRIVFRINNVIISNNFDPALIHSLVIYSPRDRIGTYRVKRIPSPMFYIAGGVVYCLYNTREVTSQIQRYSITSIFISLMTMFAALFIGLVFYRKTFLKPFNGLMRGINRISEGDIHPPFVHPGKDEFGELASAFNLMCSNLLKREKEIAHLSSYNALILDNMKSGIITAELDGKVTAINPAARKILLGEKELGAGMPADKQAERFPEAFMERIAHEVRSGEGKSFGEMTVTVSGRERIISYRFSPLLSNDQLQIGVITIFEDVTKIKNLEEKLVVSSRLAVLGEMAAGVAHQIKNPLAVMKVSMEMLIDDLAYPESDTETGDLSGFILKEIDTLDSVVNNFLVFAKPKKGMKTYERVEELLDFSLRCIRTDVYAGIHVQKEIAPDAGSFLFDRNLMVQALSNIMTNAFQSSSPGDTVTLRAYRESGPLVLEIEDQGTGMSEEVKAKMYNPFFTTKESGTGLGLSIVHRIIEDEGGTIEVTSQAGSGSLFRLVF